MEHESHTWCIVDQAPCIGRQHLENGHTTVVHPQTDDTGEWTFCDRAPPAAEVVLYSIGALLGAVALLVGGLKVRLIILRSRQLRREKDRLLYEQMLLAHEMSRMVGRQDGGGRPLFSLSTAPPGSVIAQSECPPSEYEPPTECDDTLATGLEGRRALDHDTPISPCEPPPTPAPPTVQFADPAAPSPAASSRDTSSPGEAPSSPRETLTREASSPSGTSSPSGVELPGLPGLPSWRKVPSSSRPGAFSYLHVPTGFKQAEIPTSDTPSSATLSAAGIRATSTRHAAGRAFGSSRASSSGPSSSAGSEGGAEICGIIRGDCGIGGDCGIIRGDSSPDASSRAANAPRFAKGMLMRHVTDMSDSRFVNATREDALWSTLAAAGVRIHSEQSQQSATSTEETE